MKVLWIADYSLKHSPGGAQRSDAIIINEGRNQGIEINEFNYDSNPAIIDDAHDVVITANLETISRQYPQLINFASSHVRHFRLEHDANRYLSVEQRKNLFGSARASFFLTDFHYRQFVSAYDDIFNNPQIVPDPIDTELFTDMGLDRSPHTVYTGFMHDLKGTREFVSYAMNNPDKSFVCAAWGDEIYKFVLERLPNVNFLGKIDFDEMPKFYNQHSSMFYKPRFYEPFCRSVGEAILSGMNVESNEIVGCIHEINRIGLPKFREECSIAHKTIWNKIREFF